MNKIVLIIASLIVASQAFAVVPRNGEIRNNFVADMEVTQATGFYTEVEGAQLINSTQYFNNYFDPRFPITLPVEPPHGSNTIRPLPQPRPRPVPANIEYYQLAFLYDGELTEYVKLFPGLSQLGGCGTTVTTLQPVGSPYNGGAQHGTTYTLYDHSTRVCRDFKPNQLELVIEYKDRFGNSSKITFGGNPEIIYHIMSH